MLKYILVERIVDEMQKPKYLTRQPTPSNPPMDAIRSHFYRTLVIAPHADDECFVYGSISKMRRAGCNVQVTVAAVGNHFQPHAGRVVTAKQRFDELQSAAQVLDLCPVPVRFTEMDGRLDTLPISEVITWIEKKVVRFQPTAVLPLPSHHQDHRVVYEAALAAMRPDPNSSTQLIAAYEYPFSTAWSAPYMTPPMGQIVIEISQEDLDRKLAALREHRSQVEGRHANHPLHPNSVRKLASFRGMEVGVNYAEVLYPLRIIL